MKMAKYLFPRYFRVIGYVMLPLLFIGRIYLRFYARMGDLLSGIFRPLHDSYEEWADWDKWFREYYALFYSLGNVWWDELLIAAGVIALVFIGFSREKVEDEYIWKIRMESLVWAFIVDAVLLVAATFLLFKMDYVTFMAANFFVVLTLYIVKFRIAIFRSKRVAGYEK